MTGGAGSYGNLTPAGRAPGPAPDRVLKPRNACLIRFADRKTVLEFDER